MKVSQNQAVSRGFNCEEISGETFKFHNEHRVIDHRIKTFQEILLILSQSQVLPPEGAVLDVAEGLCILGKKIEVKAEIWRLWMPKKVSVMCFFLPQVHGHKAQAQFPSFNRAARASLSFS